MEPDPVLHRAASYLRSVPEPGWDAISAKVRAAVHAAARVGWPVRASRDAKGGVVYISDHALRSLLARELRRKFVCQPTRIAFTLEGTELCAVDIDVTGSYGTQLRDLGDDIRQTVFDVIRLIFEDLDDDGSTPAGPIDVTVTDVVDGDPLG
ncbi:hypothetical protein ABIA30_001627 [Mycobacterium sp. MAA66]|uniref:hypothetical protein n=1 Tax=Mycobacterium sp. MAA66 TaxID=3156297 RepID=UPI003518E998